MRELLSKLGMIYGGYHSRTAIVPSRSGVHRLVQLRDVAAGREIVWPELIHFQAEPSASDTMLTAGDVLFQAKGAANFAVVLQDVPPRSFAAGCFFIIRPDAQRVLPAYLAWFLNQPLAQRYIRRQAGSGVLTLNVPRAVVEGVEVPVPPLAVQERIVRLVDLLAAEGRLLSELAKQRRALVNHACLKAAHNNSAEK